MSKSGPRPPSDRGQGRKPIKDGEETVVVGVRMLKEQKLKLTALGGPSWVRKMIDRAKLKSDKPSKP